MLSNRSIAASARNRARKKMSRQDRFMRHVEKGDQHWLWVGSRYGAGIRYGQFLWKATDKRIVIPAHRASWMLHVGEIPSGLIVRHKCRRPDCVNPEHLELGTHKDNAMDRDRDGTTPRGARHHNSVKEEVALEIINSSGPHTEMASKHGIWPSTVRSIRIGKTWKHLRMATC